MKKISMSHLVLGFLVLCELLTSGSLAVDDEECSGALSSLMLHCSSYIGIPGIVIPPSDNCCLFIKHADMPCFCKDEAPYVEDIVSMKKVVAIALLCGKPLPHDSKCGSKPASLALYLL